MPYCRFVRSGVLPGLKSELVEILLEGLPLCDHLGACLLLLLGALIFERVAEMRLELGPPAVVEPRPFLRTERRATLRQVPGGHQRVAVLALVAPVEEAQEVEHSLLGDRVIARKVLERQFALLPSERVEEDCACQCLIRSTLVDGVEDREPVGGVLFVA